MTYEELSAKTLAWAAARGILANSSPNTQFIKLAEEFGELAAGLVRHDDKLVADSLGDMLVVMILLAELADMDLLDCLEGAYAEIKDRKGRLTASGVFIREEPTFKLAEGAGHD